MQQDERARQFAGKLLNIFTGSILTNLLDIGYQTGLLEAAAQGPATSQELSQRAGLHERYVREWLGAMVTGGVFIYDPVSGSYALPAEHTTFLTGDSASNLAPYSRLLDNLGKRLPLLVECFRNGGGVPYSEFRPDFTDDMDASWRRIYDQQLISGFLGAAEGLQDRLQRGINVLDIGCGTGHAINLMAREYPHSNFVGYDIAEDAIAAARAEATDMRLSNVSFQVLDVAALPDHPKFDLITAFDAVHDQANPAAVLRKVNEALALGGTFLMIDLKFSSDLEDNIGNPFATLQYGISVMHCMTVSLAEGGAGLGSMWGQQTARRMLVEAGFTGVEVVDSPRPQNCIYVCCK